MDNVTHALTGCLLAAGAVSVLERRGTVLTTSFRRAAVAVGIIAAELPDADLLYAGPMLGMGKLGYLLHHRGHTHTVAFALLSAVMLWLAVLALRKPLRTAPFNGALLLLAIAGTLSHLALDFTNNYGIHPFWPVVNTWYYGDAVFIIEPWFWILTIPVLWTRYRGVVARGLLGLLLASILAAAWGIGLVQREVALVLTVATVLWWVAVRRIAARRLVAWAFALWLFVETAFFSASASAGQVVRNAVSDSTFRAAALTPFVGNPLCFNALVVETEAGEYRVSSAVVAAFGRVRPVSACGNAGATISRGGVPGDQRSTRSSTAVIRWNGEWRAPLSELSTAVQGNCEVAAAMQFIRIPAWRALPDSTFQVGDVRFGALSGFAAITATAPQTSCPRFLPGWDAPRADILRGSF